MKSKQFIRKYQWATGKWSIIILLFVISQISLEAQAFIPFDEYQNNPIYGQYVGNGKAYYPSVINVGGSYYMWFADGNGKIFRGNSSNGINWSGVTQITFNPALPGTVSPNHPAVIYNSALGYKMYFWDGSTSGLSTMVAESTNGLNWTNPRYITQDPVRYLQGGNYGTYWYHHYGPGQVIYNPNASNSGTNPWNYSYVMTFDTASEGYGVGFGVEHCGLAYSSNGNYWYRYGNNPILASSNDANWDSRYIYHGIIIRNGNTWYLWYSGANGTGSNYYAQGIGEAYSNDGLTWTKYPEPIFHFSDGIAWRNERTYAQCVLYENGQYKMWFSGKDSSQYSLGYAYTSCNKWLPGQGPSGGIYYGTAYGYSRYIAVGSQGKIAQSSDGINWTQFTPSPTTNILNDIYFNGQYFVTVGENKSLFVCNSNWQWTQRQVDIEPQTGINGVTFGNNQWIAVGDSGLIIKGNNDASNWSFVPLYEVVPDLLDVTYGNNTFVAVGKKIILTSPDGNSWTIRSMTGNYNDIAYANSLQLFVAVGQNGTIITSPDGRNWTNRTSGITTNLQSVLWQCNKFVTIGLGGIILESNNGIYWTSVNSGVTNDLYTVGFGGNTWAVLGNNIFLFNLCCARPAARALTKRLRMPSFLRCLNVLASEEK